MRTLRPHHQRTVDRAVEHFRQDPTMLAVVVGGSIAKGSETDASDVDLYLVVTPEEYARRRREKRYTLISGDFHDYEGGYVDAKFVDVPFLDAAAERGNEPTRDSFRGAFAAWSRVPDLDGRLARIPIYPEAEREAKIRSFYAQMRVYPYFVGAAAKREDPFLMAHAASQLVFFAGRLLLAHSRVLYPSQKRLMETVAALPQRPPDFMDFAVRLLAQPSPETAEALAGCVETYHDWGIDWQAALDQYTEDSELNWVDRRPPLSDW